jgi:hypothetical protein
MGVFLPFTVRGFGDNSGGVMDALCFNPRAQ